MSKIKRYWDPIDQARDEGYEDGYADATRELSDRTSKFNKNYIEPKPDQHGPMFDWPSDGGDCFTNVEGYAIVPREKYEAIEAENERLWEVITYFLDEDPQQMKRLCKELGREMEGEDE